MQNLAHEYRPIFYLHSKEKYFPLDFTRYIDQSRLKSLSDGKVLTPNAFDTRSFGNILLEHPEWNNSNYSLFLPDGMNSQIISNYNPGNLSDIPLYVKVRPVTENKQDFVYLTYAHLYAYNGPFTIFCQPYGEHYADSEDVTVKVRLEPTGALAPVDVKTSEVVGYYNSRHGGGVWLTPSEVETVGKRPVFYSALNSHASYNTPGTQIRYWGIANDSCERSILWDTNRLVFIPDTDASVSVDTLVPEDRWLLFRGKLGDGNVDGLGAKAYLSNTEVSGEYGASCEPWKWLA